MKRILLILIINVLTFTSCDSFLDELPDNRTTIDTKGEISKLLVSAYPSSAHYCLMCEIASDNVDDYLGENSLYSYIFPKQIAYWEDITTSNNEDPGRVWYTYYHAIAAANEALESIKNMGDTEELQAYKGEALLCRAYCHFCLVNVFCRNFSPKTSKTDLGIPYMMKPESTLEPHYERGTVEDVYNKIEADLEAGLPLLDDAIYSVPKYHFNRKAAYAFASRFYLFHLDYDNVIKYANMCLGNNPSSMMRDYSTWKNITRDFSLYAQDYVKDTHSCNLMLGAGMSVGGKYFGNYSTWKRFCIQKETTIAEIFNGRMPWGDSYSLEPTGTDYGYPASIVFTYTSGYTVTPKIPYYFECTDPVANTGYYRAVFPLFEAEEVLMNRAEAYAMKGEYDAAVEDMLTWQEKHIVGGIKLTRSNINNFYNNIEYYEPLGKETEISGVTVRLTPSIKKVLSPDFEYQKGEQENMIQCILQIRRLNSVFEGLRWFDIKRWGIEIDRRLINEQGKIESVVARLPVGDPRRAFQIPEDVIEAGLTANPR